jgi:hypothetical protein
MFNRVFLAPLLVACAATAAPPLTTIQDLLYKADGTRFNGMVTISWPSFQALDQSAVAAQNKTVRVVDGILFVQLVPTTSATPSVTYSVAYSSDARVQFQETWAVPSSAQTLRVRDVRVAASNSGSSGSAGSETGGVSGPVAETDVVGLVADLGARPLKGPGYAAGRVAVVDALGALETVTGSPSDCVRVDGSSGPCGTSASFVDHDSLTGIVDGSNVTFSLSGTPQPASSLAIFRNGVLLSAGEDYSANGSNIAFIPAAAPQPGDTLLASYRLASTPSSSGQLFPSAQVLCSGTGAAVNAASFGSAGSCTIPAGVLSAGDRIQISFDLDHAGTASGFTLQLLWGGTTVMQRDADATETLVDGRADAVIKTDGAQLSWQSWGASLAFGAGSLTAVDSYASGITIGFNVKLATAGDVVTLRGYSVVRLP